MIQLRSGVRFASALLITCALASSVASAAPVRKGTGAKMCVLTQADFRAFGTMVLSKPAVNVDSPQNVYCVYRGKSGATGGVELDVFFPAGQSPADIAQTFKTVLGSDPGAHYQPEGVPGAAQSVFSLSVPQSGYVPFAANAVQRGDLVFSISLPSSPFARRELLNLSELVLSRLQK